MDDPYNLARFISAQQGVYARVLAELAAGRKQSHWMWFIFPQLQGLGSSATARHYAIASLAEARAYLAHPLLGARLRECTAIVNALEGKTARAVLGHPDELKFRSCMTLFAHAAGASAERASAQGPSAGDAVDAAGGPGSAEQPFVTALRKYFAGEEDPLTRDLLRASRISG
jgi:uncharacterized protein (DUF1810 family)